jgi:hypothetical protein
VHDRPIKPDVYPELWQIQLTDRGQQRARREDTIMPGITSATQAITRSAELICAVRSRCVIAAAVQAPRADQVTELNGSHSRYRRQDG